MENFEGDPHSPDLQLKKSVSSENDNGLKLPPETVSISWCKEKTSQLENQRGLALSRKIHDDELPEKIIKHYDQSLIKARRNDYSPPGRTMKNFSPYEFAGDVTYFGVNKHPSIHDMIDISEEVFVPYDQVFHRFSELRIINHERCEKNDTCERVSKYFISKIGYNGLLTENTVAMMHHEFKNFIHLGPMTDTGRIHLIVDKLDLAPDTVRKFYYKWFIKSRQLESTLETVVFEEQKLYQREIERHHAHMQNTPGDHEYSKRMSRRDLKTESLLRIIHKRPEMTVSEAIIVSSIYKVDIKKIHLLVKKNLESMRIIQECFEDNCDSEFVNFTPSNVSNRKYDNDPSTFDSAPEDDREQQECKRNIRNDIEMGEEQKNVDLIPDGNPHASLALTAEMLNISNMLSGPDCSKNRFAGDFQLFELNRHPSIGEMLAISKMTGAKYKQVFYRFRDFRNALKEPCPRNDNCRKVLKFFAHRTEYDGILHGKSVNKMYDLFEKFGADGKSPDIGYIHLVAEQVDLPAFVVREQYKEWFMSMKKEEDEDESSDTPEINRKKELYERLENEYSASSEISYERLVHMAKKYDTTQKNILNFFDSKIEHIEELPESAIPEASSDLHEALNVSIGKNSTKEILNQLNEKFLKNDFNSKPNNYELYQQEPSKKASNNSNLAKNAIGTDYYEANESLYEMSQNTPHVSGGSINSRHSENQREQVETEDVEIDVVGLDDDSGESEVEITHTADDYKSIYQFPDDFEIFQANRHPTILEMINISYDTGVSYEQVFFRFKHFRKLNNEVCSPGDPCEKVEKFSEANPDLGGVLDKRTLGIIYEEFEHLIHLGYYLPLGYIHMIMEKVDLPASVIRLQYGEWYSKRRGYPKGVLPDMSNSTMLTGLAPKEEDRLYLTNDESVQSGENNTGKE
ncbi:hypothetical protein GCK72_010246 [Caenorhabditis remanei]|uniref:Homeobox-cysteine loop-homeobox domain-containing protein n=1 Tax=Caenorhabditis remanei TaxID=31234 RepID=A0A6A5H564_CAERE|nr:hypothetical protein GCK72_010246 [Caenorhabditis remanei]KAF1761986.1 hypothetical protein GCK72_010246 [Caenorhabditis remanei]